MSYRLITPLIPIRKRKQYDWRATTKVDTYSYKTLVGNWNEERYDLNKLEERKPLPSQYSHYYETSYSSDNIWRGKGASAERQVFRKEHHVFPGHQPELGPPEYRTLPDSCYTFDYSNPNEKPMKSLADY